MRGVLACGGLGMALLAACGSFGDAGGSSPATSPADAGTSTDAAADGAPAIDAASTFCRSQTRPFVLCSSFDESTAIDQATLPDGKKWRYEHGGVATAAVASGVASSPPNAIAFTSDGTTSPPSALARIDDLALRADATLIRLDFALDVAARPTAGDAFIVPLTFPNVELALVLHADGTLGLSQRVGLEAPSKFTAPDAPPVAVGAFTRISLVVDRAASKVAVQVAGVGGATQLLQAPQGNASLGVGIGYCDVPCGQPAFAIDDVVLRAE